MSEKRKLRKLAAAQSPEPAAPVANTTDRAALLDAIKPKEPEATELKPTEGDAPKTVTVPELIGSIHDGIMQVLQNVRGRRKLAKDYGSKPAEKALAEVDSWLTQLATSTQGTVNALKSKAKK